MSRKLLPPSLCRVTEAVLLVAALCVVVGCKDSVSGFLSCGIDVCSAREACVDTVNGPACVCAEGFEGAGCSKCASGYRRASDNRCDLIPIDCVDAPSVCGVHGTCVAQAGGDTCKCDELYAGRLCELCDAGYQDNDSDGVCRPSCATAKLDCRAPSRCSDARGTAICDCPAGYTGDDCSFCALGYRDTGKACVATCAAAVTSCSANQVCVDTPSGVRCECSEGRSGAACAGCAAGYREDPSTGACLPSCEGDISCGEHGRCDDSVGFARCVCDLGNTGEACQDCLPEFAKASGGSCQRVLGSAETLVMSASYQGRQILASVDPDTGKALPLVESDAAGVAEGPEPEQLFVNRAGTLELLQLPDGTKKALVPGSGALGPLAWDASAKRVYAISGKEPFPVLSIDPGTKVIVELFATNLAGVADLAVDAPNHRLLALRDTLHAIDLTDGAVSNLGPLPPATLGIASRDSGQLWALAAADTDEATARVQACRATAARLELSGYSAATGRFVQPAGSVDAVSLQAVTEDQREVVSYLGRGAKSVPRTVSVDVVNAQAVVCLALEEGTRIEVSERARYRALVVYAADAPVELLDAAPELAEPRTFLGGHAPQFEFSERSDVVAFTPQEWRARRLPIDMRFYQPGPGVLRLLDAAFAVESSTPLVGSAVPAGPLSVWRPVAP